MSDDLTPTEYLVLDVLSARRRLGESLWTFPRHTRRTLRTLEAKGYIGFKESGPSGDPQAWFNEMRPDLIGDWTKHVIEYRPVQPDDGDIIDRLHILYGMPYDSHEADVLRYHLALAPARDEDEAVPLYVDPALKSATVRGLSAPTVAEPPPPGWKPQPGEPRFDLLEHTAPTLWQRLRRRLKGSPDD